MAIEIGQSYFVRTDTDHWLGRVTSIDGPYTLTLEDFSWVADSGRLSEFLAGKRPSSLENEPAPSGMTITVTWKACISWPYPLLREVI